MTRDGHNPDRKPFKLDIKSDILNSYEGLSEIETQISEDYLNTPVNLEEIEKSYKNSLRKAEKVHMHAINEASKSIKLQEIIDDKRRQDKKQDDSKLKEKTKVSERKVEEISILEEIILFQRLLRGRKEQNMMHEGKSNRAELIKELRAADYWKTAGVVEEENKLINDYVDKLMNGVIDAVQGHKIAETLDYMSKEMLRIKEEQKIFAVVNFAENERRKREAEEMGRRQAEDITQNRQNSMYKEVLEVNQGTMDTYINSLFSKTVNNVSKKQVMREIEIKANKLNRIVDKIENHFIKDDVTVRDLVSSFIIPEIDRKKVEDLGKNFF